MRRSAVVVRRFTYGETNGYSEIAHAPERNFAAEDCDDDEGIDLATRRYQRPGCDEPGESCQVIVTRDGQRTLHETRRAPWSHRSPGAKMAGTAELVASVPYNMAKAAEHSRSAPPQTPEGQRVEPADESVVGSTLTEINSTLKTGARAARGANPGSAPLDRVRVDSGGQRITTNQGVPVADNQNSLKAGLRRPALLEDFVLREKITHFDHARIPERIVQARGSGAHGYFECYEPLVKYTRASLFAKAGKRTPVLVRFSLALALIALSYAAATAIDAWGFLSVFAAGIGLRHAEVLAVGEDPHPKAEQTDAQVHPPAETLVSPTQ